MFHMNYLFLFLIISKVFLIY